MVLEFMATFHIAPPKQFEFSQPNSWHVWIKRFERFRLASGLSEQDESTQIAALVYSMGSKAETVLASFTLKEDERKAYDSVKRKFDSHFVKRRNVIFERAKFNYRRQGDDESVESFVTALHTLSEHWRDQFGALSEELILWDHAMQSYRRSSKWTQTSPSIKPSRVLDKVSR